MTDNSSCPLPAYRKIQRTNENLKLILREILKELKLNEKQIGFQYVFEIEFVLLTTDCPDRFHVGIYDALSKLHGTTYMAIERAIRHSIETAWQKGRAMETLLNLDYGAKKPSNRDFVNALHNKLMNIL